MIELVQLACAVALICAYRAWLRRRRMRVQLDRAAARIRVERGEA